MCIIYCFNSNEQELDALVDIKDDSKMSYGCMWLVPRGPNILEFSIIGEHLLCIIY